MGVSHELSLHLVRPESGRPGLRERIRRAVSRGRAPQGPDLMSSGGNPSPDFVIDYTASRVSFQNEQEMRTTWSLRPIKQSDIDSMIEDGWFKDPLRVNHLKGDLINKDTLPADWHDEKQVTAFKSRLRDFYFPGGKFVIQAVDNNGEIIRDATVERRTLVVVKDGVLAGTTSWLTGDETGDPWSDPAEDKMRSHTQMHFVAKEFSGQGLGLFLAIGRTEAIFAELDKSGKPKYEEIVTWVNSVGDYHVNEALFESMGYEETGHKMYINTTDPERAVKMRRYILNRETWVNGAVRPDGLRVGRAASVERWEEKKKGKSHRPPNLG